MRRAGYGLRHDPPSQCVIARSQERLRLHSSLPQNAAMKRLFELREAGKLRTIILPYLGQDNSRLNHRLDPAAQAAFTPLAQAALKAAGVRTFNTAGGKVVAIEGAPPPKNAVINEWDSLEQATAFTIEGVE